MPELPEVETARRYIAPSVAGRTVVKAGVYTEQLRHPLDPFLASALQGIRIAAVRRRGKYLLLYAESGCLLLHLGMTGHLLIVPSTEVAGKHDRLDLELDDGMVLRFSDPRRFGTVLWVDGDPMTHPLLSGLGPEPLEDGFGGRVLLSACRGRRRPIKTLLMDARVIAGIGNIYAAESLFRARIHPEMPADVLNDEQCERLAGAIKDVLGEAVDRGDQVVSQFAEKRPQPGYFNLCTAVYGRKGMACLHCGSTLEEIRQAGRSTVFCPSCQSHG